MIFLAFVMTFLEISSSWFLTKIIESFVTHPDDGIENGNSSSLSAPRLYAYAILHPATYDLHRMILNLLSRMSAHIVKWTRDVWYFATVRHILELPLSFHDRNDSGALTSTIDRAMLSLMDLIRVITAHDILISMPSFVSCLFVILACYPQLWWAYIVSIPIYVLSTYYLENNRQKTASAYKPLSDAWDLRHSDVIKNVRLVKNFGKSRDEVRALAHIFGMMRVIDDKLRRLHLGNRIVETLVEMSSKTLLLVALLSSLLEGQIRVSQIPMLLAFQTMIFWPVSNINNSYVTIRDALRHIRPVIGILRERDTFADHSKSVDLSRITEGIEIKNLSFKYNFNQEFNIFNDINLNIRPGTTALVGRSGSGKSTLAALLQRLYSPSCGAIFWDGMDLRCATKASIAKQIAVTPQSTFKPI
jgi:ABC-type bacteriocin/lantibiotic exporter with double-glycine peptidase domain